MIKPYGPYDFMPPIGSFSLTSESVTASNAQDLWIGLGLARGGRTFPNDPVMVIE
ncbi:hypothetical protein [Streptomyces sp. NPDC002758]